MFLCMGRGEAGTEARPETMNFKAESGRGARVQGEKGGVVLTAIDGVVVRRCAVACRVQRFLAPATRIPRAAPGVVVIGTRSRFHLLLEDHPSDATPNL